MISGPGSWTARVAAIILLLLSVAVLSVVQRLTATPPYAYGSAGDGPSRLDPESSPGMCDPETGTSGGRSRVDVSIHNARTSSQFCASTNRP